MIPIRTSVDVPGVPGAVIGLIIANFVVFTAQTGLPPDLAEQFIRHNGLIPMRYTDPDVARELGLSPSDLLPFITSSFMHVGVVHLIINMWTLWLFGRPLEQRLGAPRFLLFYLAGGVIGNLSHIAFNVSSPIPALGASGAIAGLLGGYALTFPRSKIVLLSFALFFPLTYELTAIAYMVLWFVFQVAPGLADFLVPPQTGGIAWWAHIGGFLAGLVLVQLIGTRRHREKEIGPAHAGVRAVGAERPRVVRVASEPIRRPRFATMFNRRPQKRVKKDSIPSKAPAPMVPGMEVASAIGRLARSMIPDTKAETKMSPASPRTASTADDRGAGGPWR